MNDRMTKTPASDEVEVAGDELSPSAEKIFTRSVEIFAATDEVWRWLMQIGQDRSGFYSHTALENLVGCRMPREHHVHPEWLDRAPGDRVWMADPARFRGKAFNVVARVEPCRTLVLVGRGDDRLLRAGKEATWVWQFDLRPLDNVSTRLTVRSRYLHRLRWLEPIHRLMERKMMYTIKRLAEHHGPQHDDGVVGTSGPIGRRESGM